MTKDSVGELRRKTKRYGQDVASTPLILEQGGQNVRIIYTLDAGYGGLLDEDVRTKFADFQKKFQDAVTALVSALAAALPALLAGGGSVQEISAKLEAAFGASLSTVSAGLAAFLSLIFKLADQGLGYVKLHGTLLELRCLGPAPAG